MRHLDPSAVVGDYVVLTSLWRDRLGEVCRARGPRGEVRLRLTRRVDADRVGPALERLARMRAPGLAPILERLTGPSGAVAVVTSADALTLADRRWRGQMTPTTVAAFGAVLLDALAALHEAGLAHGAVSAAVVGIAADGRPRWQDCCLAGGGGLSAGIAQADDTRRAADLLRKIDAPVPAAAAVIEAAASGAPGAPTDAAALAQQWRAAAVAAGIAVPPVGADVVLPDLVASATAVRRSLRAGRGVRRGAAVLMAAAGVATVPVARAVPGGSAPFAAIGDYLPSTAHRTLTFAYDLDTAAGRQTGTVRVRIAQSGTVAGVETISLVQDAVIPGDGEAPATGSGPSAAVPGAAGAAGVSPASPPASLGLQLPLGLAGATLRLEGGAITRTAAGGVIRDLVAPVDPGTTWSDRRATGSGFGVDEERTLVGSVDLDTPAGRLTDCALVVDTTQAFNPAGAAGAAAKVIAWYCPGVGLARAVLSGGGETDVLTLVGVGS